jgi:hypothetical protein
MGVGASVQKYTDACHALDDLYGQDSVRSSDGFDGMYDEKAIRLASAISPPPPPSLGGGALRFSCALAVYMHKPPPQQNTPKQRAPAASKSPSAEQREETTELQISGLKLSSRVCFVSLFSLLFFVTGISFLALKSRCRVG